MYVIERYKADITTVPEISLTWNMYGAGIESIGRDGRPEALPVSDPGDD